MNRRRLSTGSMTSCLLALACVLACPVSSTSAATVYFSDDFESGLGQWEVGGDSWQITDLRYRSPGRCASDSPTGNYPGNANSIMTMKLLHRVDLSESTDPVLRFWHRIGVDNGDHGYVELSEDLGFTWITLRSYTDTSRSTWSFEQIDLSAHRASARPILVRFRLRDDGIIRFGAYTVSWGGEIDDLAIMERDAETIPFPLFDDMESGLGNWMVEVGEGGEAWQIADSFSRSPSRCLSESANGNYPGGACSDLVLAHPIDLSSSSFPVLTFWHRIGVDDSDHGYLHVSQDGGTLWSEKPLKDYTNLWLANWTYEQVDLSEYRGSPILIRFRLRDDGNIRFGQHTVASGWDIDDIEVRELIYPAFELIVQIADIDTSNCPVIRATVTVTDAEGAVVADLKKSDFSIYEDDEARMTVSVEPDVSAVYASLALDYSGSMVAARAIADVEDAAKRFVDLLGPQDWGRIIKFANGVCGITEGFANDKVVLTADIDNPSMACKDTATWLYDAIYQAVSDTADQPGRKAVVVMTDGRDQRTKPGRSATEVISHALANGVPVFTIGLGAEVDEPVLTTIAVQTGGVYYFAPASGDLEAIYRKIAGVLKSQYIVSYETAVCELEGAANQEHELEILVVDGASAGQGAKRFSCPPVCGAQTGEGAAP